jgi:cytochrome P450
MEAGSDTTSSVLLNFVLALTKYPDVLKEAQKELDAVCATERSPTVQDFDKLPYMSACVAEVESFHSSFFDVAEDLRFSGGVP